MYICIETHRTAQMSINKMLVEEAHSRVLGSNKSKLRISLHTREGQGVPGGRNKSMYSTVVLKVWSLDQPHLEVYLKASPQDAPQPC